MATQLPLDQNNAPQGNVEPLKGILDEDLHQKYLLEGDPTEYRFAVRHIGSWEAWESVCLDDKNVAMIGLWRRELDAKIRSESLRRILNAAQEETRDALQANKFLLEAPWAKEDRKKAGRPSTELIKQEADKLVEQKDKIYQDYNRIFNINLNKEQNDS